MDGRAFLVNARPLPTGGAVLVIHDLTEVRRLEAVRRDFVANVSHELKTPLTSISGYAETLLGDTPDAETTRRFLEHDPGQRPPDAAAGGRPARPVAHRGGPLAARAASAVGHRGGRGARVVERARGPRRGAAWSSSTLRSPGAASRVRGPRRPAPDPHQPARQLAPLHASPAGASSAAAGGDGAGWR